ncbi:hypothetical protein [Methanothrix soehngenii]
MMVADGLTENPERAFSGIGNRRKYEARIAEPERLLGLAMLNMK